MPYPVSKILSGRIFQSFNLVQIMMVQPQPQRLKGLLDLRKIQKPAGVWIDLPFADKFNAKAMAVQPATLMPGWGIR